MIRVHIVCEGQTEETFVKELLIARFATRGIYLYPALLGKVARHKGGRVNFDRLLKHIENVLQNDPAVFCTTFFDFYALPETFPGKQAAAQKATAAEKAAIVQRALAAAITAHLGDHVARRLIPYVQMYEFEGLLFSDPAKLADVIGAETGSQLQAIRDSFTSPEEINDSPETAPGKRITKLVRGYDKPIDGTLAALEIGLGTIRRECALFDGWLRAMENLQPDSA